MFEILTEIMKSHLRHCEVLNGPGGSTSEDSAAISEESY